jgi:type VI secretion system protein ImpL
MPADKSTKKAIIIMLAIICTLMIVPGTSALAADNSNLLRNYKTPTAIITTLVILLSLITILLKKIKSINISREFNKMTEELQGHFLGAIKFLKKTIIGQGKDKKKLNNLPWYLFIGAPESGKTSLLAYPKIPYILAKNYKANNGIKIIPSSYVCNWWITSNIVIVDVPGYYTFSALASNCLAIADKQYHSFSHKKKLCLDLWYNLLKLLKKHNKQHDIRAVIVAVNLADLQHTSRQQQQLWQQELQARLTEYWQKFGNLPLYLVITKMDLIPGFLEFFSHMSTEELNQLWGITLDHSNNDPRSVLTQFNNQFNHLIKQVNNQLLWRLHIEHNEQTRHLIKDFPLQLETIKARLAQIIKTLLASNPKLILTGIYLTSATQSQKDMPASLSLTEIPLNAIAMAENYNFSNRCFFIKKLINYVLPYTAAEYNKLRASKLAKYKLACYIIYLLLLTAAILWLGQLLIQNLHTTYSLEHDINEYNAYGENYENMPAVFGLHYSIALLNDLAKARNTMPTTTLFLSKIKTYYGNQAHEDSQQLYQLALKNILLPQLENILANYLSTLITNDERNINFGQLYDALQAYLMLQPSNNNLINTQYTSFIISQLCTIFALPTALQHEVLIKLNPHLQAALKLSSFVLLNSDLITQSRQILNSLSSPQLGDIILNHGYNNSSFIFALNTENTIPALQLNNQISLIVPNIFTKDGYLHQINGQELQQIATEVITGNAVLGEKVHNLASFTYTPAINVLTSELSTKFVKDYSNFWQQIVEQLSLFKANTIESIDEIIINWLSNDSSLTKLVILINNNTNLKLILDHSKPLTNLNDLIVAANQQKNNNPLGAILIDLYKLHTLIQQKLHNNADNKAQIIAYSKQLKRLAVHYPAPINNCVIHLLNNILELLSTDT